MRAYTLDRIGIRLTDGYINVGESGRGRTLVRVPVPDDAVVQNDDLLSIPGAATAALVLIPDQSGYRGGWRMDGDAQIVAEGYSAQGDAGRMGGGPEYLIVLKHGHSVVITRSGRLYGAPAVVRLTNNAGVVTLTDVAAEEAAAAAAAKFGAIAGEYGSEPVETELRWGGGGTKRAAGESWATRPVLRVANEDYWFVGKSIDGVVDVLENVSKTSGYSITRYAAYRVMLHPGVEYVGNRYYDESEK